MYHVKIDEFGQFQRAIFSLGEWLSDHEDDGAVIGFDPKAKVTRFGLPAVMITGFTPGGNILPYAFCILSDETSLSFQWALEKIVEMTGWKIPQAVFTDQDPAIGDAAIKTLATNDGHTVAVLWDEWHLLKHHQKNCGGKKKTR